MRERWQKTLHRPRSQNLPDGAAGAFCFACCSSGVLLLYAGRNRLPLLMTDHIMIIDVYNK